ncbi:hypothetical protein SDC9_184399 [bioreactor metagenome]|uniref:Uncharacterized protein n=1 Tax=bioreactor metagenome TaxID=1076179 RepID=A0A645HCY7_9ZZZZ|nr:TIGR01440 family protein [Oscillospiraceae bacterium]
MYDEIKSQAAQAISSLLAVAKLKPGDVFVIGCSSSEICGKKIGTFSSMDAAQAVFDGVYPIIKENGLYLAVQCCEHLNRSLIVERECALKYGFTEVNVVPHAHAGGAFATTAYARFDAPSAVEEVRASAGMDIGDTLIGMHIIPVCVPVRCEIKKIGEANVVLCRRRPKFVGGERAIYNNNLM